MRALALQHWKQMLCWTQMLWHGTPQTKERPKLFSKTISGFIYTTAGKKNLFTTEGWTPSAQIMSQRTQAKVLPDICVDGCMQSLIDFHPAMRAPVKVLLLQNNLHSLGFKWTHISLRRKPTRRRQRHSSEGLQRFEIATVFAVQHSDFYHSSSVRSSYVWLNELCSRKSSHLTRLNAILKSPLL